MSQAIMQFAPVFPEIFVLAMVSLILVIDAAVDDSKRYLAYVLSLATLAGAAVLTLHGFSSMPALALHGLFIDDPLSDVLKLFLYLTVAVVLVYSRDYLRLRGLYKGEFFALTLFALLGMMVMVSASHFLTLYLGLELLALSLYAMVALQRDSRVATEAAMKYFVLGALASGMLLYGMSVVYGVTGSGSGGYRHRPAGRHGPAHPAGVRHRLHRRRPRVQTRRGTVPYVAAGRV